MVRHLLLIHHIHTNNRFELAAALFDELRELVDRVARRLELVDSRTLLSTLRSLEESKARYGGIELSDALQFVQKNLILVVFHVNQASQVFGREK